MLLHWNIETSIMRALVRRADSNTFPLAVAGTALAATLSMSVPFAGLLVAAVLLAPGRWISVAAWSSLGAAVGALILYLIFHHLGWNQFVARYPDVMQSVAWRDATNWLNHYGIGALLVIAALPLPLTPGLMFAGISRLPVAEVIAALWAGKLAKYLVYAWLTSRFPQGLFRVGQRQVELLRALMRGG